MCLNIGTPKNINFPFETNGKLMLLGVSILKHFRVNAATSELQSFTTALNPPPHTYQIFPNHKKWEFAKPCHRHQAKDMHTLINDQRLPSPNHRNTHGTPIINPSLLQHSEVIPLIRCVELSSDNSCCMSVCTLQRRYNAGDGSHKIEPRYKWYRAITTSALSAPPTNPKTSRLPVRTKYLTITR